MRVKYFLFFFVIGITAGIIVYVLSVDYSTDLHEDVEFNDANGNTNLHQMKNEIVYLYFADKNNLFLHTEKRIFPQQLDQLEFGRKIIKALIEGPKGELVRTLPKDTSLNALYITQDKTAYVDFSKTIKDNYPGGNQTEIMTIYSIVNSLILNILRIDKVKILIGGWESDTLSGHLDLRHPFKANMLIVR